MKRSRRCARNSSASRRRPIPSTALTTLQKAPLRTFSINEKTDEQVKEAEAHLAVGKPRQLMVIPSWWWVISARTFLDRLTNSPDLVENAKRIKCPVLFIRGDQEPKDNYPAERFKENCAGPCEVVIIPDCDHFYIGAEDRVAKAVTDWLTRTLG